MRKVIIDCDPGHDDAIMLILASRAENIEILGITTAAGNGELVDTSQNALNVLNYAGVYDIPVYAGSAKPMMRDLYKTTGEIIHGEDGLGGPTFPKATQELEDMHAVEYIIKTLRATDEKITVITTGPVTNVALAFILAPDIKEKIDRLVVMGGAVYHVGIITSAACFNMYQDPEAAKILFNSGVPLYLHPLDVTMASQFTPANIKTLLDSDNKVSVLVGELLDFFSKTHEILFGEFQCPIHDALCVATLMDDTLIKYRSVHCDISLNDPLTVGETVADIWNLTDNEPNIELAVEIDRDRFVDLIIEYMQKPYLSKR